jgi:hypothetical protein
MAEVEIAKAAEPKKKDEASTVETTSTAKVSPSKAKKRRVD